ncbi:MAG: hypothetical protein WDK96_01050 [Candidatus Paceibacterota bacterium]|jgi:hypothetical protein
MEIAQIDKTIKRLDKEDGDEARNRKLDLCFDLMRKYSNIAKDFRSEEDHRALSFAVKVLDKNVFKCKDRIKDFIKNEQMSIPNSLRLVLGQIILS